jgi:aspartyl-tRNA(Asn)/glutamyl-tRNA(Gln) amidotransferase subunit B
MEPVIGLEVHAQLNTRTKLFCACPAGGSVEPNTHICEICTGQPGALPRLNGRAVELAAKATLALGGQVNGYSLFARKNYFYPDLPNGFQTSQLDPPIGTGGSLSVAAGDGGRKAIRLNRIHMEDDAGKCVHDEKRDRTLIDLNRAGVPLIEIVTEPDLSSSREAMEFLKTLHSLLVRLEVTKGRLEEGEFRCDVNISLKPKGSSVLGVRGEIKNLNSFKFVGQAIDYEIRRQSALYESGGRVEQQTLHFDHLKGETRALRSKEEAHDYRYFPQPDLPPVLVSRVKLREIVQSLPPPADTIKESYKELGLKEDTVTALLDRPGAQAYFEEAFKRFPEAKRLGTLMVELFLPALRQSGTDPQSAVMGPAKLAALARLMSDGVLTKKAAYDLFPELFETGADPRQLVEARGLSRVRDESTLQGWIMEVIAGHPEEVKKYLAGQTKILSFLVGQLMRLSRGTADPQKASASLTQALEDLRS